MFRDGLFTGQRILVSGGGTGLGRAMAERFLQLGATVCICGRRLPVLQQTADELMAKHGGTVQSCAVDIRDAAAVDAMVESLWQEGPLTGLVNNAAGNFISRTEDLSERGFNAIADTVFRGTFYLTQAVGKRWIAGKTGGTVVSIVVTWVWTGSPFVVPSAMSKAGIDAMTKSLAIEWGHHGIRFNAIAPGVIPTEGASKRLRPGDGSSDAIAAANPMRRVGRLDEIGNLAAFLMSDECSWINGQTIALDGGDYLANGAYFKQYFAWDDEDWRAAKERIRQQNERDKAQRAELGAGAA
jgi:NAD(P)-dependent dehydrogenase (short-subunit alcohol dehydrogenase family)